MPSPQESSDETSSESNVDTSNSEPSERSSSLSSQPSSEGSTSNYTTASEGLSSSTTSSPSSKSLTNDDTSTSAAEEIQSSSESDEYIQVPINRPVPRRFQQPSITTRASPTMALVRSEVSARSTINRPALRQFPLPSLSTNASHGVALIQPNRSLETSQSNSTISAGLKRRLSPNTTTSAGSDISMAPVIPEKDVFDPKRPRLNADVDVSHSTLPPPRNVISQSTPIEQSQNAVAPTDEKKKEEEDQLALPSRQDIPEDSSNEKKEKNEAEKEYDDEA